MGRTLSYSSFLSISIVTIVSFNDGDIINIGFYCRIIGGFIRIGITGGIIRMVIGDNAREFLSEGVRKVLSCVQAWHSSMMMLTHVSVSRGTGG